MCKSICDPNLFLHELLREAAQSHIWKENLQPHVDHSHSHTTLTEIIINFRRGKNRCQSQAKTFKQNSPDTRIHIHCIVNILLEVDFQTEIFALFSGFMGYLTMTTKYIWHILSFFCSCFFFNPV